MATSYVILHKRIGEGLFDVLEARVEAASSTAAVRAAALDVGTGGEYVAIPDRSFDPITIEIETNPRVKVVKGQG